MKSKCRLIAIWLMISFNSFIETGEWFIHKSIDCLFSMSALTTSANIQKIIF